MAANLQALRERRPQNQALDRYRRVAELLTGETGADAEAGISWVRVLVADLQIRPLGSYGIDGQATKELIEKAARASSMKGNPVVLTPEELAGIFESAL
jgi:alcohol dehydrogenase class IV